MSARARLRELGQRYWFDALILVGLGVGIGVAIDDLHTKDGPQGPLWFDVLAVVAWSTPLLARRRFPTAAPLAVGVAVSLAALVDVELIKDEFPAFLFGIAVSVLFGMRPARLQGLGGLAFVYGVQALIEGLDPKGSVGDGVFTCLVFTVAWIAGFAVGGKVREVGEAKERAARAVREREEQARLAVAEERARIARELHDVVGHSVSVMTVQASAVRRLVEPDQEQVRDALLVVEQTGREALAEMRRMVGVLRRPEEAPALAPQPSLDQLDRLVAHAREAGLPVNLRVEGDPVPLAAGIDLTVYRLVQEGLTNAIKHAGASRAEVLVRYDDGHVELTVSDDGNGVGGGEGSGHGLVGMRERVSVYGGELEAGPKPGGGFLLRATLPVT